MQKGNTLILLRDIVPPAGSPTNYAEPQFVGLAMNYRLLDLTSTFTQKIGPKYDVQLQADFVRNMAYNPKAPFRYGALDYPLTNGILNSSGGTNLFVPDKLLSGPNGYQGIVTVGDLVIHDQWQWNVFAGYRYLQPDAVIDGFTYADFHLGGTNAKGYILGGTLAFYKDTTATVRWLSADQIFGPRLAIDVLQLDLNTYF